jgi:hypothetical protein
MESTVIPSPVMVVALFARVGGSDGYMTFDWGSMLNEAVAIRVKGQIVVCAISSPAPPWFKTLEFSPTL